MVITSVTVVCLTPTICQNAQNSEENPQTNIWSAIFAKKMPPTASNPHSKIKHPLSFSFFSSFLQLFFYYAFFSNSSRIIIQAIRSIGNQAIFSTSKQANRFKNLLDPKPLNSSNKPNCPQTEFETKFKQNFFFYTESEETRPRTRM